MASTTTQWILELVDKITGPLRSATESAQKMTDTVEQTTDEVEQLGQQANETASTLEKFGKGMFFMNEIKDGVDGITDAFDNAIQPGVQFQYAMSQVQAISGIAGDKFDLVQQKARDLAKTFGVDASDAAGVFSTLLSQLGPQIAEYPDAIESMARSSLTLSKTMDGDVAGAVRALTTSFNAFEGEATDVDSAAKLMNMQMNLIAKSAQVGAAEVVDISESLKNIGPAASNLGVSFAETNALFQVLGQNQIKAAEAGTALRNSMLILSAPTSDAAKALQALGVDMSVMADKSIPFADRLKELVPVMNNTEVMARLFGRENVVAGQILVGNTEKIKQWTEEVQGSNSAVDQANIIMNTTAERMKRMDAFINDLKISFFQFVEPFAPIIKVLGVVTGAIVTLGMVAFSVTNIMQLGITKTAITWAASCKLITRSIYGIPIIGWVLAVIGAIATLYNSWEGFRVYFMGFVNSVKELFVQLVKIVVSAVKAIVKSINPANWFDDSFKFSDVWEQFAKEAKAGGEKIAMAWNEGKAKGQESWNRSRGITTYLPQMNKQTSISFAPKTTDGNNLSSGSTSTGGNGTIGLGGSGKSGGARNITMNVTMNNTFTVSGDSDYRKISERLKREMIAILSDVTPAIG
jgi:TP901 family phage tail tape measure protein|nr:MAG TPA: minor tail protein [Caudoviricetes sp.]